MIVEPDGPLIQQQDSKEPGSVRQSSSRSGSGRKIDLSNVDDSSPIIERKGDDNVQHEDYLGHIERPKTSALRRTQNNAAHFDDDAADILPD